MSETKKKVRKKLQSVPSAAPVAGEAKPKTGPELVSEAVERFNEACDRLELGVMLLNEAGPAYWKSIENDTLKKQIQDYVQKASFGLSSLRDEVCGVLSAPPATKKMELVPIDMPVAHIPMAAVFKDHATAADLASARDTVGMALQIVLPANITVDQAEGALRVSTFLIELHKNLKAMAEKAKAAA